MFLISGIFSVTLSLNCSILFEPTWPAVSWYHSLVESGLSSDFQICFQIKTSDHPLALQDRDRKLRRL